MQVPSSSARAATHHLQPELSPINITPTVPPRAAPLLLAGRPETAHRPKPLGLSPKPGSRNGAQHRSNSGVSGPRATPREASTRCVGEAQQEAPGTLSRCPWDRAAEMGSAVPNCSQCTAEQEGAESVPSRANRLVLGARRNQSNKRSLQPTAM